MREADRDQVREKVRPDRNEYFKQLEGYVLLKKCAFVVRGSNAWLWRSRGRSHHERMRHRSWVS